MKLTRLKVHRYRDIAPGCELVFSPTLNLVLGENGTGRTTLLELLARVLGSDFSALLQEEFALEYELTLGGIGVHVSVRNTRDLAAVGPTGGEALLPLRTPEGAPGLAPAVEMTLALEAPASRLVMRADATGVAWEVDGTPGYSQTMDWSLLDRPLWVVLLMTVHRLGPEVRDRLKTLLTRVFLLGPSRFDEALGMFEHIGRIQYGMELHGDEVFPLGLMALPTWLSARLRERVEGRPPADIIEFHHDEAGQGFLSRFVTLAGFSAGRLRVELLEKRAFRDGGRLEFGRFGFSFTRRDGSVVSGEQLGYGQRRLLSFLYYLDVNGDFAIADELAGGLHPRWVEACVRELGERQAFLTSQNPLLLEHLPLPSAAEVRRTLVLCRTELHAGRERWVWANPTEEAATRLSGALRGGTTPLAALLQSQGLW